MGASNESAQSGKKQFYQLKEEKVNEKGTGNLYFGLQGKVNEKWETVQKFKHLEGYITGMSIDSYDYQGNPKENLIIKMIDNEDTSKEMTVTLGFSTVLARNILNTLGGEKSLRLIRFSCGEPSHVNGKIWPTLWVNNDGERTNWKYSDKNGNRHEVPSVTSETDDDRNVIKRGVAAAASFWKNEMNLINDKIDVSSYPKTTPSAHPVTSYSAKPMETPDFSPQSNGDDDDLPF